MGNDASICDKWGKQSTERLFHSSSSNINNPTIRYLKKHLSMDVRLLPFPYRSDSLSIKVCSVPGRMRQRKYLFTFTSSHIGPGSNQIPPYRYSGFGINNAEGTRTGLVSSFGDFLHGMFRVVEMIARRQAFRAHFIHSYIR